MQHGDTDDLSLLFVFHILTGLMRRDVYIYICKKKGDAACSVPGSLSGKQPLDSGLEFVVCSTSHSPEPTAEPGYMVGSWNHMKHILKKINPPNFAMNSCTTISHLPVFNI